MDYKNELNEQQFKAVTTEAQYVRIVAGAGSGKTRVLTYRIAYLLDVGHYSPYEILAFTFTNKVAAEMKERAIKLVGDPARSVMIKTFHSFAAWFLRHEITVMGFPTTFTILDEEDQTKMVKDIVAEKGYKRSDSIVGRALGFIGKCKLHEKYPDDINKDSLTYFEEKEIFDIYEKYENQKDKMLSLDFDDLLLFTNHILKNFPEIRAKYQRKFSNILIDEFQDTNDIEYKMIKYLMSNDSQLYVVGDPDQTIYTFRGANQEIILKLERQFPMIETIILNRNYRSTQTILDHANKLIANNKDRIHKDLFTKNCSGDAVTIRNFDSFDDEGRYIAREIMNLHHRDGYSFEDIAILYRANYITLNIERALKHMDIPYRIYGGVKFYARREVKDVLAYFHLIENKKDDISFERALGAPKRNIGPTTITKLKVGAKEHDLSMYEYIESEFFDDCDISAALNNKLKALVTKINMLRDDVKQEDGEAFSKILKDFISEIGYYDFLSKEDDGDERKENVDAIFDDINVYLKDNPTATFSEYLQNVSLTAGQDEIEDGDHVTLMTVHTAKGLEYPVVFIARFNQNVFPSARALNEGGLKGVEEERRLAYVAITRAKEKLYITLNSGYAFNIGESLTPSQFLREGKFNCGSMNQSFGGYGSYDGFGSNRRMKEYYSGDNHYHQNTPKFDKGPKEENFISQIDSNEISDWHVGDEINHKKFGHGVVTKVEGDAIIDVNFDEFGSKTLSATHPSITRIKKAS